MMKKNASCISRVTFFLCAANIVGCNYHVTVTTMPDPDFGEMRFNIDAWDCRVKYDFPHRHTHSFAVHIWSKDTGPSEAQRVAFRELKSRYHQLWPEIASGILGVHPTLKSVDDLNESISPFVAVHIGEHAEDSVELVYNLSLPTEGSRGYFVSLYEWKVKEVIVAD
jgi:hypothetical protein